MTALRDTNDGHEVLRLLVLAWEALARGRSGEAKALLRRLLGGEPPELAGWQTDYACFLLVQTRAVGEDLCRKVRWFMFERCRGREGALLSLCHRLSAVGDVEAARMVVVDCHDARIRLRGWCALGSAAALGRRPREARNAFLRAVSNAQEIDDKSARSKALSEICMDLARSGDLEGATRTAAVIEGWWTRWEALAGIAQHELRSGDALAALRTLAEVDFRWASDLALSVFASAQAGTGDFAAAMSTIARLSDRTYLVEALNAIAAESVLRGRNGRGFDLFVDALAAAHGLEDHSRRSEAMASTASKLLSSGAFREAYRVASQIEVPAVRSQSLARLSRGASRAAQRDLAQVSFEGALDAARKAPSDLERAGALRSVLAALPTPEAILRVFQEVPSLEDKGLRAELLRSIGRIEAEFGDSRSARASFLAATVTGQEIQEEQSRMAALLAISEAQLEVGYEKEARSAIEIALSTCSAKETVSRPLSPKAVGT